MVSPSSFSKIVQGLPEVEVKRELREEDIGRVSGGEPFIECTFEDDTFWDDAFRLASNELSR